MKKTKRIGKIVPGVLLLLVLGAYLAFLFWPRYPFKELQSGDVAYAAANYYTLQYVLTEDEKEELLEYLRQTVVYNKVRASESYYGANTRLTLFMEDGSQINVQAIAGCLSIGTGTYRADDVSAANISGLTRRYAERIVEAEDLG